MAKLHDLSREFVSEEQRSFGFKIGRTLASALSGFIAGVIFASIVWALILLFFRTYIMF